MSHRWKTSLSTRAHPTRVASRSTTAADQQVCEQEQLPELDQRRQPSITGKETRSKLARCATSLPRRSTLCGFVPGTTTKAMKPSPLTGQRGYRTHSKSPCGRMAGSPKNHKITGKRPYRSRGRDVGTPWNQCHCNHGKVCRSLWTQHRPPTTRHPRRGFSHFASTPFLLGHY